MSTEAAKAFLNTPRGKERHEAYLKYRTLVDKLTTDINYFIGECHFEQDDLMRLKHCLEAFKSCEFRDKKEKHELAAKLKTLPNIIRDKLDDRKIDITRQFHVILKDVMAVFGELFNMEVPEIQITMDTENDKMCAETEQAKFFKDSGFLTQLDNLRVVNLSNKPSMRGKFFIDIGELFASYGLTESNELIQFAFSNDDDFIEISKKIRSDIISCINAGNQKNMLSNMKTAFFNKWFPILGMKEIVESEINTEPSQAAEPPQAAEPSQAAEVKRQRTEPDAEGHEGERSAVEARSDESTSMTSDSV